MPQTSKVAASEQPPNMQSETLRLLASSRCVLGLCTHPFACSPAVCDTLPPSPPSAPCRDVFAVLEEPPPVVPAVGKSKKKRGKDGEKWAAAEAAAIAASMAAATVVRIKALDGLGCTTTCHQVGGGRLLEE